ncbi:hypothetical protein GDO86_010803 [Hymenochirus boettgeri]|uniref:Tumor protein p53-inducible nuclear protein 1 n=1 Tax=Hymenochirus boettgeri TaxID=247094 RepID=A0A8T2JGQ1_9PIPI|nr:hypothetical protein GDO86_010803 [Hymenochirus boettgeri]KAG8441762.1 hypothetical protein GDO86_010803 [Hymenochirus boettgeri]
MFQRLNDMFSGEPSNISRTEAKLSEKEDDEWIIVDFIVDTCTGLSEEAATFEEIPCVDEIPDLPHISTTFEQLETTSDSYCIHFNSCPMEESWFVTPPPCFTAGELTTIKVETSPMENLLIEHPSMSVYAVKNGCYTQETGCESVLPSNDSIDLQSEEVKTVKRIRCYIAALAARLKGLETPKKYRSEKLAKRQSEKHLNRKCFRLQNRIQGCRFQQHKYSGFLLHQPSQRQYNY